MAETTKSLAQLCLSASIDLRTLAERSGVDEQRLMAIVLGRWTPSPEDRDAIAGVFGLTRWARGVLDMPNSIVRIVSATGYHPSHDSPPWTTG